MGLTRSGRRRGWCPRLSLILLIFGPGCAPQPAIGDHLAVLCPRGFGALLGPVIDAWGREAGLDVHLAEDSPERIARQVNGGAQADLFISAEPSWVEELQRDDHLSGDAPLELFVDPLVIVTRAQPERPVHAPRDLIAPKPLRTAVPERGWEGAAVRRAMEAAGVWAPLEAHSIRVEDGGAAVELLLASGAEAAVVRRTAALSADTAVTATRWPAQAGAEVRVQAAVLRTARRPEAATALAAHLAEAPGARRALDALGLHHAAPEPPVPHHPP
jgi:molybdate transport system substrate-binding protein